jgi:hypothetical protein
MKKGIVLLASILIVAMFMAIILYGILYGYGIELIMCFIAIVLVYVIYQHISIFIE